jgi:hypothetical protein
LSCQHAHRVLAQLIKEATRNSYSLHFCTLDISKAFDSICHAQAFYALSQLGVNASVILVLKFWYSNSYLRLKSGSGDFFGHIPVKCGVRQGGVLFPHIFIASIEHDLSGICSYCLMGFTDVSYLAYADDLVLIRRTEFGLARSVRSVTTAFESIGLFLNVHKCEYLTFNYF